MKVRGERIHFHGLDRSDYFFLSDTINADHAEQDFVDELIKKYPVFEVRSLTPQTHEADTDMNINGYLKYAGIIMLAAGLILLMVQGVMKRTKSQNS